MSGLRPYQARAIEDARRHVNAGRRAPLVVSATGTGKTRTGAEIARAHVALGGRVLWMAHRTELVDQAARDLTATGLRVGVIAAKSRYRPNPHASVQVASMQTLTARGTLFVPTMIVFDEAHHAPAESFGALLKRWPDALRLGLTATPERQDGRGLGEYFDCLVTALSMREAIDEGHLTPIDVVAPNRPLSSREIAQRPVDAYLAHARGQQAVVFAPHVAAAEQYAAEFTDAGVATGVITGTLTGGDRRRVLDDHAAGRRQVLCGVAVLTEGWDSPRTSCCILARGCGSAGLYIQIVGRVVRLFPGKTRALLIDLRGVVHVHGRPDEDRVYSLDGKGIRRATEDAGPESFCPVCSAIMPVGSTVCADCGNERQGPASPTVTGDALRVYARDALRGDSPQRQVQRLAKWLREAVQRGHKPASALYKFKALYDRWPTRTEQLAAEAAA